MNLDQLTPALLRRVDYLIGEKVTGQKFLTHCTGCDEEFDGFVEYGDWACAICDYSYGSDPTAPHYTTDPAAALGLLSVLRGKGYYLYTTMDPTGIWCGVQDPTFRYPVGYYQAKASTLPLAVVAAVCQAEGLEVNGASGD